MGDWRDLGSNHWRHDDETYEVVFRPVLVSWTDTGEKAEGEVAELRLVNAGPDLGPLRGHSGPFFALASNLGEDEANQDIDANSRRIAADAALYQAHLILHEGSQG
jgi:hypothetical protein